ncbi:MAG: endonuclease V [Candidatus Bathyarchaeia archaeon]|nr:endonuclease V [Candidatus Bathyarchaeia archaeon]
MNTVSIKPKFSIEKAHKTQLQLSKQIVSKDKLPEKIRLVAGVDVAYAKGISIGAIAVLDYNSLKLVESQTALCKTRFPYIPTLLSFREIPPTVLSIKKLRVQPDIFLVDGHGFAHPYRCGFASHLGLVIGKPTIGVAKSWLFGEVENVKAEENVVFLEHANEVAGAVVTTKSGCKPVYISIGHMISLETAIKIVKHCTRYNRIPEPVLKAHETATTEKRKINIASAINK